jgi:hypothetical protein
MFEFTLCCFRHDLSRALIQNAELSSKHLVQLGNWDSAVFADLVREDAD